MIKLVKVKPYGKDQGPYVLMEEQDFDPKKFTLYDPVAEAAAEKAKAEAEKAAQEAEAKRLAEEAAKAKQPQQPAPAGKK